MSGNSLETPCNAAGDPCTEENSQSITSISGKLLDVNVAAGDPGVGEQITMPNQVTNGNSVMDKLTKEVQERTIECDNYEKTIAEAENQLASLKTTDNNDPKAITSNEVSLRRELEDVKKKLIQAELKCEDRNRLIANQENHINALTKQVSSLKEVIALTKNLLEIRNAEVKHLKEDVNSMGSKVSAEKSRHDTMINEMNAAVRLNESLKAEYETQLRLFQDLRGKYQEKVTLLSSENKALEMAAASKVE